MNRIDLTQAEWQLMEKLWEHAPQTGRELTEAMAAQTGWNRSTTLTLLRRLMEKGAVRCDAQGRKNVFYPAVRREDAAARQRDDEARGAPTARDRRAARTAAGDGGEKAP